MDMVKNNKVKGSHLALFVLILILIANTQPFYLWNAPIGYIVALGVTLFMLWDFNCSPIKQFSFCLLFVFYIIASVHAYNSNITGVFFYGILPLSFYFIGDKNWLYVYKKFLLIYSIALVPSLIVYFIVVWGNVDLPHTVIPPLNALKTHDYLSYPFLVVPDRLDISRFFGYFDEPGVIGTFSGTLFLVNRCDLKDWKNWVLLISGIFSFSLLFYGMVVFYILFWGSIKSKIFLGIVVIISIIYFVGSDSVYADLILNRLEYDSTDGFVGDNRTTLEFDSFWKRFIKSEMFWYGYGTTYAETIVNSSGSSYKNIIVDSGIIMFLLYIVALVFYYLSYKLKFKTLVLVFFLMIANLYQRPFIFSLAYIFILISPPVILKTKE